MKKLVFVCLGNICLVALWEFLLKSMTDNYTKSKVEQLPLGHGNPIHKGTQGIFFKSMRFLMTRTRHRFRLKWNFEAFDYIIGMDAFHISLTYVRCVQ